MTARAPQHRCRPLWLGPGVVPRCIEPTHFWAPLTFTYCGNLRRDVAR